MFSLYFLDAYINMVKYLQKVHLEKVPLNVSINLRYLHQDTGKNYSEISKMRSYWKCSKATICRHRSKIWRWSLTYLINSKEARGKSCEIWLKLKLLNNMSTFQTLQRWIGHNATCYRNLNTLSHALSHALRYILSEICLVLGYL